MQLQFLGATQTVTGSKYLLKSHDKRILIDCGLYQGRKDLRERNWARPPVNPANIDAVVLTHAHIDHTGYLPILVREGYKGPIYATSATIAFAEILLRDAGRLQEEDARRAERYHYSKHTPVLPLFTEEDAKRCLKQLKALDFGVEYPMGEELKLTLSRAGHILGAAMLTFRDANSRVVFSGDLGRPNDPIVRGPATLQDASCLILESTYGSRNHPRSSAKQELADIINKTIKRGGNILIPSFAVGRTQTVLYLLHQLLEEKLIPKLPIFLDSPMAKDATQILRSQMKEHKLSEELCEKICKLPKYIHTVDESKALNDLSEPAIILSASGMAEGGRVLHHIAHMAPQAKHSLVFTGFQAPMTRGDRILRGEPSVKIHGEMVPIHCEVYRLESLSSHADAGEILDWLAAFRSTPRVYLIHGEPESCEALKKRIEDRFHWDVYIPELFEEISV